MYQDSAFFHYCVNVGRIILSRFVIHQNIGKDMDVSLCTTDAMPRKRPEHIIARTIG